MSVLWWAKRDLRLFDNAALLRAAALGPLVPVFIVEPAYWALPDTSLRQFLFLRETLAGLQADLRALGSDLVVRRGDAVEVLEALRLDTGATQIISHEETGNAWTFARDKRVAAWARDRGVMWEQCPQSAVRRGRHDRDQWAAARNRLIAAAPLQAPVALPPVRLVPEPDAFDISMQPDPCVSRQPGGGGEAQRLLRTFLKERGRTYRSDMSSPLTGAVACSRLSPHLALGSLSVRQVSQACADQQRAVRGTRDGWAGSLKSFQSRLAWRDHFIQKLEDEPPLEWRCLHPAYEGLRPRTPDAARFNAWSKGETGLPFVDACMRSLIATGWLNFRMRSMLMAVASYHLWLPWQKTGQHLARMFTDYEPGIHWSQCQMQSGTTGINTLRIYNPIKQGHDQDPDGSFTRQWLPELSDVPDVLLQEPWRWDGRAHYPPPIVDVAAAAKAARDKVWAVRQGDGFRDKAAKVVAKHASRKDPQRHFVNDRAARPRKAKSDDRQLKFDL